MQDSFDAVIVGAGAAGIAALRRLAGRGLSVVALEARDRVGGRAHTVLLRPDLPVDCGAGWVHSADENPLTGPIAAAGFTLDRSPPHWMKQAFNRDFSEEDQRAYRQAFNALDVRLEAAAATGVDRPASDFLEPGNRWNPLLDAFSSYYNGAEFDQVSVLDYAAYEDSGVNWRVREGYGAAIASFAEGLEIVTGCPVTTIHHDGPRLALETPNGRVTARAVIVCVPTPTIAEGRLAFSPGLPAKADAAAGLPLGLADKVFLGVDDPEALPVGRPSLRPRRPHRDRQLPPAPLRAALYRGLSRRTDSARPGGGRARRGGGLRAGAAWRPDGLGVPPTPAPLG